MPGWEFGALLNSNDHGLGAEQALDASLAEADFLHPENIPLAPSENRSHKSADGRVAKEAAWLHGKDGRTKERALFTLDRDWPSHGRTWQEKRDSIRCYEELVSTSAIWVHGGDVDDFGLFLILRTPYLNLKHSRKRTGLIIDFEIVMAWLYRTKIELPVGVCNNGFDRSMAQHIAGPTILIKHQLGVWAHNGLPIPAERMEDREIASDYGSSQICDLIEISNSPCASKYP